jgi:hypothetical protein
MKKLSFAVLMLVAVTSAQASVLDFSTAADVANFTVPEGVELTLSHDAGNGAMLAQAAYNQALTAIYGGTQDLVEYDITLTFGTSNNRAGAGALLRAAYDGTEEKTTGMGFFIKVGYGEILDEGVPTGTSNCWVGFQPGMGLRGWGNTGGMVYPTVLPRVIGDGSQIHVKVWADGDTYTAEVSDSVGMLYTSTTTSSAYNGTIEGPSVARWDNGTGDSQYLIDNYVVPEPATMSLLAIGGLAMLRRRR